MPRTPEDVERERDKKLAQLNEDEVHARGKIWFQFIAHALMCWFIGLVGWYIWPYFLSPPLWPHTLSVLGLIAHIVGYVAAAFGGLLTFAFVITRGKIFEDD
jgi:TRAP-type C4-dicarboxylate transport system permease small subunit